MHMNGLFKKTALALATAASFGAGSTLAATADTKGGLKIKSDDGNFEASLGGRIHYDGNFFVEDDDIPGGETDSTFFRRARLTLSGKAYGWKYKFENDFAGQSGSSGSGFREMWIGTKVGPADMRIGQAKPHRGMEELTSSNEVLFMERPWATATGIYDGRQFAQGLFFDGHGSNWTWGAAAYNLRDADGPETDGKGFSGRVTYVPMMNKLAVLHIGATASVDRPEDGNVVEAAAKPAGRLSSTEDIAAGDDGRTAFGLEAAYRNGPFYVQSEYVKATFENDAASDEDVTTYYIQGSWLLTGESKPYDAKKGVFKSPKPAGDKGAWEAKAKYDVIKNDDVSNLEVNQAIVGLNWYYNPNVRFMFEYIDGTNEFLNRDLSTLAARVQFSF
jgi:phosphate-selective porin OprO/OprP